MFATPHSRDADADLVHALVDDAQRIRQRGEDDDRGAVLVVVEDRDVERLAQPGLDLEAARRRDVLEVDPAVDRGDRLHDLDDGVGVLGVEADRPGVDAGELLEQRRLALHHRKRRLRADVSEAENGRSVGDDGDGVALDGEPADVLGIARDRHRHPRHARRVRPGQVVAVLERHLRRHLDLAADMQQERAVADLADDDIGQLLNRVGDAVGMVHVDGVARDVDDDAVAHAVRDVEGRERAALLADRRRQQRSHLPRGGRLDANGDGVARAGRRHLHTPLRRSLTPSALVGTDEIMPPAQLGSSPGCTRAGQR
jgi:hypothetical protein